MGAINPVKYTTPDGVDRLLRWTLGSHRRMSDMFGLGGLGEVLKKHANGAVPGLIWCSLFDSKGNPPDGLTFEEFQESFPGDEETATEAFVALMAAYGQGKQTKNEVAAAYGLKSLNGSNSGVSAASASGSPTPNSGISTPPNSSPSPSDTPQPSEPSTTEPVS